jgi:hypothetical protein
VEHSWPGRREYAGWVELVVSDDAAVEDMTDSVNLTHLATLVEAVHSYPVRQPIIEVGLDLGQERLALFVCRLGGAPLGTALLGVVLLGTALLACCGHGGPSLSPPVWRRAGWDHAAPACP